MLKPSWQDSLTATVTGLQNRHNRLPRVVVVGIGHDLRGDDAAGSLVARKLITPLSPPLPHKEGGEPESHPSPTKGEETGKGGFWVIDAGSAPENVTGAVRKFAPDLVLLVDAADLNEPPGAVRWLDWRETSGLSASTHTLPPYVLAGYLVSELSCEVALLGIQPASTEFDAPLTPAVRAAVDAVVAGLREVLSA